MSASLLFHPRKQKAKPATTSNPLLPGAKTINSRVQVRAVAAPMPMKRKAEDALGVKVNGAPAMKKARSSSAESSTPPPIRSAKSKAPTPTPLREVKTTKSTRPAMDVEVKRERSATPASALVSSQSRSRSPTPVVKKEKGKGKAREGSEGGREGRSCLSDVAFDPASMRTYVDAYGGDLSKFRTWFENPADASDTTFAVTDTAFPSAYLELPARNARAHYILAVRKDPDAYAPLYDLEETLAVVVDHYLPEDLKEIFGPHPDDVNLGAYGLQKDLHRARTKKNGPLFLSILDTINGHIQKLKYPPLPPDLDSYADGPENKMMDRVKEWTDMPEKVAERIFEETYQCVVPPHYKRLQEYASFSSETYGEMLPPFVHRIIKENKLGPNDVLVDLGAGVGNVLIQASLATGCETYGVEIQKGAAEVGLEQLAQARARAAAWGVKLGPMTFEEGDMLTSPGVDEALRRASVVVCNNKMFSESLNTALKSKFLDLPEGARIVSLHPFAPPDARNNARSREAIETILTVQTRSYGSRDVSWSGGGGDYYVHTVDRAGLAKMRAAETGASGRSSRARR
ncbi:unnamed protein product [Peniophora sp. CBMAI 1063]|nr:unnamed protein product [Peniophora sp. CBMAI 1063]